MNPRIFPLLGLLFVLLQSASAVAQQFSPVAPISAQSPTNELIGRHIAYLKETNGRLTLDQAIAAYRGGQFTPSPTPFLDFGLGSQPVWVHFSVDNADTLPVVLQMSVETAWLDLVDVYFRQGGNTSAEYHTGDRRPFSTRPIDSRYFKFDYAFAPGVSAVWVRVETPDPMVLPIKLLSIAQARAQERWQGYSYGLIYGFLFALLAYNVMLYIGLRKPQYILYSVYLAMFLWMNMLYTGHVATWLQLDHPLSWLQWLNPLSMMLYGGSGLIFALSFLEARNHLPRVYLAIVACLSIFVLLQLLAVFPDSQLFSLVVAFVFAIFFTLAMLALGIVAARSGLRSAKYFLLAAITALVGAAMTTLSLLGFIPYNTVTFRTIEIGMLLDATLLALALAYQFRLGQEDKVRAEQMAQLDPLTDINNRRAFYDKAASIWSVSQRHNRNLSLILFDIDRFKHINDTYGHAYGDQVLKEIAAVTMQTIRDQDVAARWGGEEFILLLPETSLTEGVALAERLRSTIATIRINQTDTQDIITASFGVAQKDKHHANLDELISVADKFLYQSKETGRNKVSYAMALSVT